MPEEQKLSFDDRGQLLTHLEQDMNIDPKKAERIADIIMEEAQSNEGQPRQLLQSIKEGAKNILSDIDLETVSWVKNPSQDSMFLMMKDDNKHVNKTAKLMKEPEQDWDTVYGPVMRASDIDKDGDVAPGAEIREAAHEFMKEGKVNSFDSDHDQVTGKGTMVESWILKESKVYELPDGDKEEIEAGAWMVGVQPDKEIKERIQQGDITGWSIFGEAEKLELGKDDPSFNNKAKSNSLKGNNTMVENQSDNTEKEENRGGDDLTLKDVHSEVQAVKEAVESPDPETVKSVDELENTLKSLEQKDSTVVEVGKDFTVSKEDEFENMSDLMDYLEDSLNESNFSMLMDAVRGDSEEESEDEGEVMEEEDMEDEEEEEKQEEAKAKGSTTKGIGTNQDEVEKDTGLSFNKAAKEYRQEV